MIRGLIGALVLLVVLAGAGGVWLYLDFQAFRDRPLTVQGDRSELVLERGSSIRSVAEHLSTRGLLDRPPQYLEALARLDGRARRIQAGQYLVEIGTTPDELLDQLVAGRVVQYSLVLVEGWNYREVLQAVVADPNLEHTLPSADGAELMSMLGRPETHPEGRFFPDTYHFPKGTTDVEFLRRAMNAMDAVLEEQWSQRVEALPLTTPEEALVLASIIERETGKASERTDIAGVFVRRLQKGMKLQTDPTVIYGLGETFDGNLRRKDLRADTPYNTYTRHGLPPTPIAMPGREAIHAALHPAEGDTLYFVARGDGSHQFSATLKEHNRAVRKYQLGQ